MNVLKLSVVIPVRPFPFLSLAIAAIVALSVGYFGGQINGYGRGLRDGMVLGGLEPPSQEADGCGIDNPLACMALIAGSIVDYTSPLPEHIVETTKTRIVVCEVAERAYDACLADEACGTETYKAFAQELLECTAPTRH